MRDVLRRSGAGESLVRESLFDVLATARECHDVLAGVAFKLPSPVPSCDSDSVSKCLRLASEFGSVHCRREALRTVNLDRIGCPPCTVGTTGPVSIPQRGL